MTEFDPVKAQTDIVAGAMEVRKVFSLMLREAERVAGEAEARLDALMKIDGWLLEDIQRKQAKLQALRSEAGRKKAATPDQNATRDDPKPTPTP